MLRFTVYDKNGLDSHWSLVNPYLLGPESLPVKGRVTFKDGIVTCQGPPNDALAFCTQFETETIGRFMLQTCLLPPRQKPYSLSIELARNRIRLFLTKSEEWQMFDLSAEHPALKHWEEARRLFTESITTDDPRVADQAAKLSLIHGIEASERLALAHADLLLHRRYGSKAASSTTLGVRICPEIDSPKIREMLKPEFDVIVVPIRWRDVEPKEGRYRWDALDKWMDWAKESGKPIVAGPLMDYSKEALPEWMDVWKHDFDSTRDQTYDYIEQVVDRYKSVVGIWNVASGINVNDNFEFTVEQMVDLVRMVSVHVRQARKGARVMIELTRPFGEYRVVNRDSMAPLPFIDRIMQEGIRLDALGVQLLFGCNHRGMQTRDIMQISALLDRFYWLDLPILVSAMGVPSTTVDDHGGWWRQAWSPSLQSKWITQVFALSMSKPFVESVFWTDMVDHDGALLDGAGLINAAGQVKPSFKRIGEVRKRLRSPLGKLKLPRRTEVESPIENSDSDTG
ncbi:MAG: endo-1,4-beta-xylanase [Planctomycetota bacterium]|nr:endo-1,4-beta-xylanase [Planctomycetota bacterium]